MEEKLFYPLETPPPIAHFLVSSSEHQAEGYADDILITTTPANDLKDTQYSLLTTTAPVWSRGLINVQHIASRERGCPIQRNLNSEEPLP